MYNIGIFVVLGTMAIWTAVEIRLDLKRDARRKAMKRHPSNYGK